MVGRVAWLEDRFWAASARSWDDVLDDPAAAARVGELVAWLGAPGPVVVDLGCGTGNHVAALVAEAGAGAGAGRTVVGVDRSVAMLARAAAKVAGAGFVRADLGRGLPLATAGVDGVLSVYAAQFLALGPFLAEVRRVLRPGGVVVVELPGPVPARRSLRHLSWRYRVFRVVKSAVAGVGRRVGRVRTVTPEGLRAALVAAGFSSVEVRVAGAAVAARAVG